jgi:hypothetical protein
MIMREIQYQKEQDELAHLRKMDDFITSNFKRRANTIKSEMANEVKIFESAQKAKEGFAARFESEEVRFEERRARIISAGLSQDGKDIQSRGMAEFFRRRMDVALGADDFSQALNYAKRMQDIFAQLSERQDNPFKTADFENFLESQEKITSIIKREQDANESALNTSRERIQGLTDDLSTLFVELQNELILDVSTERAREELADLRKAFVELRKDFAGLLPGGENFNYEIDPERTLFEKPTAVATATPVENKSIMEQEKTNRILADIDAWLKQSTATDKATPSRRGFTQDLSGQFVRETIKAN